MPDYIWGQNPVLETLRSNRQVKRLLLAEGQRDAPAIAAILEEARRRQVPVETVARQRLDQFSKGAVHQGCLAVVEARTYASLEQILHRRITCRIVPASSARLSVPSRSERVIALTTP